MKPTRIWVLVADGKRARVLKQAGTMGDLEAVPGGTFEHALHKTSDLGSDKPGRVQESVGGAHHAVTPKSDYHREEKHQFARDLAKFLEHAAERKEYDRLILVAAPRTLGDLREALGKHARDLISGELDKDLTEMTVADIAKRLVQAALL
ncbi:MAG: host attachment protein [Candidatus Eiseniibacteriota bacterium]